MNPTLALSLQGDSLTIVLIGVVLALLQIYAIVRPNPALHKQFADKEATTESLNKIEKAHTDALGKIETLLEKWAKENKNDRRMIYNRLNSHDRALWFITGRLERKGPHDSGSRDADQMRKILTAEDEPNE